MVVPPAGRELWPKNRMTGVAAELAKGDRLFVKVEHLSLGGHCVDSVVKGIPAVVQFCNGILRRFRVKEESSRLPFRQWEIVEAATYFIRTASHTSQRGCLTSEVDILRPRKSVYKAGAHEVEASAISMQRRYLGMICGAQRAATKILWRERVI